MAKLCMGCMNPLPEGETACAVCGFDIATDKNPEHCLPVTASLQGHYIVGRLMGEFPDHLLYLAYDRQMKEPCFIQEFYPAGIGHRDTIGGVQPLEGCDKAFEELADNFRSTMRVLARMRELPAVVPVYDIFEENGTVYATSDYCQGMTLTKKIKLSGGRIAWPEARSMFMPLLSSLAQLGDAGVCHLAICPDNILIGSDGKARLRNFSVVAAHRAGTDLTPEYKTGYTAPEQYYPDEEVGTPADVYALAATIFRTVTGTEPPAGDNRAKNSDDLFMSAEIAEELTQPVCVALFNALQVLPEKRTADVAQLRDQLSITPKVSALVDEANEDIAKEEKETAPRSDGRTSLIVMLIISLVLLLASTVVIVWLVLGGTDSKSGDSSNNTVSTQQKEEDKTPVPGEGEELVPYLEGEIYADLVAEDFNGMEIQTIGTVHDTQQEDGLILAQFPDANTVQALGSPVYIVVTSQEVPSDPVKFPDLIGIPEDKAISLLRDTFGFDAKNIKIVRNYTSSTVEYGCVAETNIAPGTSVSCNREVQLCISGKKAVIPDLTGCQENAAKSVLADLGFTKVTVKEDSESKLDNGVVSSVAGAGGPATPDTEIVIYVSKGTSGRE